MSEEQHNENEEELTSIEEVIEMVEGVVEDVQQNGVNRLAFVTLADAVISMAEIVEEAQDDIVLPPGVLIDQELYENLQEFLISLAPRFSQIQALVPEDRHPEMLDIVNAVTEQSGEMYMRVAECDGIPLEESVIGFVERMGDSVGLSPDMIESLAQETLSKVKDNQDD